MQGFYANLLTKNVAMGGNVQGSALSAYTAGSQRHTQMTTSTATETDSSSINIDGCLKRKYSGDDADSIVESGVVRSSCKVIVNYVDSLRDEDSTVRVESDLPNLSMESAFLETESIPLLSKAEIISSARQRFLDRKIASSVK